MTNLDFTQVSTFDVIPGDIVLIQGQIPRVRTVTKVGEFYSKMNDSSAYCVELNDGSLINADAVKSLLVAKE